MKVVEKEDYSDISDKKEENEKNLIEKYEPKVSTSSERRSSVNLGIYRDENGLLRSYKYCGYSYLKDKDDQVIKDDYRDPVVLHIKPRFGLDLSGMLQKIADDEEFFDYLGLNTDDPLVEFFYDEPMIESIQVSDDMNRVIMAISFITLLERNTRISLIKKMVTREDNMVGRIKGHIHFRKQISKNVIQGHKERVYSVYNSRTEDIDENRLLLQTLGIAEAYLGDNIISGMRMKISMIRNRLWNVSRKTDVLFRYDDAERMRTRLSNIYRNYDDVFNYAKLILREGAVTGKYDINSNGVKIVPYAVNSHMLYECYARACLKERIAHINNDTKLNSGYSIEMLRYVQDKSNDELDDSYGVRSVIKNDKKCYISGKVVPDIVLKYIPQKEKKDAGEFYRIYDVKYKDASMGFNSGRDDRLQLLAYNLIYHPVDNHTAFIMPKVVVKDSKDKEIVKDIISGKINTEQIDIRGAVIRLDNNGKDFNPQKVDYICEAIKPK